jgi:hypothetical protein
MAGQRGQRYPERRLIAQASAADSRARSLLQDPRFIEPWWDQRTTFARHGATEQDTLEIYAPAARTNASYTTWILRPEKGDPPQEFLRRRLPQSCMLRQPNARGPQRLHRSFSRVQRPLAGPEAPREICKAQTVGSFAAPPLRGSWYDEYVV